MLHSIMHCLVCWEVTKLNFLAGLRQLHNSAVNVKMIEMDNQIKDVIISQTFNIRQLLWFFFSFFQISLF